MILLSDVKKFENSLLKMYLVNASINNKSDKINDFFKQMTSELQNQSEWKEWFSKYKIYTFNKGQLN